MITVKKNFLVYIFSVLLICSNENCEIDVYGEINRKDSYWLKSHFFGFILKKWTFPKSPTSKSVLGLWRCALMSSDWGSFFICCRWYGSFSIRFRERSTYIGSEKVFLTPTLSGRDIVYAVGRAVVWPY